MLYLDGILGSELVDLLKTWGIKCFRRKMFFFSVVLRICHHVWQRKLMNIWRKYFKDTYFMNWPFWMETCGVFSWGNFINRDEVWNVILDAVLIPWEVLLDPLCFPDLSFFQVIHFGLLMFVQQAILHKWQCCYRGAKGGAICFRPHSLKRVCICVPME